MTNNLKLITTETFGDLSCNFYRNMNDDILLTREQIGLALEYVDPINSIYKIHKRHKDRLDKLSICLSDGLGHEIYYYSQKGIMEICRWSKSDKANQFMDWVWDIVEKYRNHELTQQIDMPPMTETITYNYKKLEIWKDIKGYEGLYQVSNLGRIKSLDRYIQQGNRMAMFKSKILKQRHEKNGYLKVTLYKNTTPKQMLEHRVVAETFIDNTNHLPQE